MKRPPPRWYEMKDIIIDLKTWREKGELYDKIMCKRWNVADREELEGHLARLRREEVAHKKWVQERNNGIIPLAINHYQPPGQMN